MTISADLPATDPVNIALSWRALPLDPAETQKFYYHYGVWAAIWFVALFVGGYTHPIPSAWSKHMKPYDKMIWRHRVVSIYHAVLALTFSGYWYISQFDLSCSKKNTDLEYTLAANTAMFLCADALFMLVNGFLTAGNLWHHIFGFVGYTTSAYLQYNLGFLSYVLFPAEISNIQMNMREVYKRMKWRYSKSYYFNEFQYLIIYFICRTTWIPSTYYFMFICETLNPFVAVIFPLHIAMNYYYSSHIPKLFKQRVGELNKIKANGFSLKWFEGLDAEKLKKVGITSYEAYKT